MACDFLGVAVWKHKHHRLHRYTTAMHLKMHSKEDCEIPNPPILVTLKFHRDGLFGVCWSNENVYKIVQSQLVYLVLLETYGKTSLKLKQYTVENVDDNADNKRFPRFKPDEIPVSWNWHYFKSFQRLPNAIVPVYFLSGIFIRLTTMFFNWNTIW